MSNVNADSIFIQGHEHQICEDYAHAGKMFGVYPYVIISDGCSSSDYTDVGARIITRAFTSIKKADLEECIDMIHEDEVDDHIIGSKLYQLFFKIVAYKVSRIAMEMGLTISALDATVRFAIILHNRLFLFHYGDGFTILKNHTTGEVEQMWYTDYPYNAPFYPIYPFMDHISSSNYESTYTETFDEQDVECDGEQYEVHQYVAKKRNFYHLLDLRTLDLGTYTISVMSDGVETFFENNENLSTENVVDEMLSFKNFRGEFVQRKVRKYLHLNAKKNIQHYDDISLASLVFEIGEDINE